MRILKSVFLATALAFPVAGAAFATDAPRITVTGEGRVDTRPDMATISLGVTTQGATAAEAMAANSTQLATVLANLKTAGIADADLQTSGLSLNPNWSQSDSGSAAQISGYIASNMLTVRVRALDGLGGVLDAAVTDGANTLNGVTFGLAEPNPVLDEARKRAVADATHRATLLSSAAGTELGNVISITEGGGYVEPGPMFRMAADAASVPVAEGQVAMSANVTMVWELKE